MVFEWGATHRVFVIAVADVQLVTQGLRKAYAGLVPSDRQDKNGGVATEEDFPPIGDGIWLPQHDLEGRGKGPSEGRLRTLTGQPRFRSEEHFGQRKTNVFSSTPWYQYAQPRLEVGVHEQTESLQPAQRRRRSGKSEQNEHHCCVSAAYKIRE